MDTSRHPKFMIMMTSRAFLKWIQSYHSKMKQNNSTKFLGYASEFTIKMASQSPQTPTPHFSWIFAFGAPPLCEAPARLGHVLARRQAWRHFRNWACHNTHRHALILIARAFRRIREKFRSGVLGGLGANSIVNFKRRVAHKLV